MVDNNSSILQPPTHKSSEVKSHFLNSANESDGVVHEIPLAQQNHIISVSQLSNSFDSKLRATLTSIPPASKPSYLVKNIMDNERTADTPILNVIPNEQFVININSMNSESRFSPPLAVSKRNQIHIKSVFSNDKIEV